MDLASGLFALSGVALAGLIAEVRARREASYKRTQDLVELRRLTYAAAIRQMETVASKCARWLEAVDKQAAADAFWSALTEAYETLNELRLLVVDLETAEQYKALLGIYRAVVEGSGTQLPKPAQERDRLVHLFRSELGR